MGICIGRKTKEETWAYTWELSNLDGVVIKHDRNEIKITKKGIRRKLAYWNSYKARAVVLGNLRPHVEYLLHVKFSSNDKQSEKLLVASLTVDNREQLQMQAFLVIFSIIMTIIMTTLARGCGI